jgi:alkanesulfonate monooxygenase SsuD/methylene tetrahydromethanopterin reductase-like flavin-dependent oxidoreductase (luciferase family)
VAQVDQMSGGRVELGLGTGWFDAEHAAYGLAFPGLGERFEIFEEQLAIITGLWTTAPGETFSFTGKHYTVAESPALPKPVRQPRPPIVIGGWGSKRTPRLAAAYADDFNSGFGSLSDTQDSFNRVRAAVEQAGRSESSMIYSTAQTVCCGRDEAEVERRAAAIGRKADEMRDTCLVGTPDELIAKIAKFAELGTQRIYLQVLDLDDIEHLELIAAEVLPAI